jgi:outer membrane protein
MSFVCRGIALLAVSGGCASSLARPSVPYGGHSLHFATSTIAAAGASGAPGETPPAATGDISLADAYKLALRRSDTVELAELGIRDAELTLRETGTEIRPNVTMSAKGTAQGDSIVGTTQPHAFAVGSLDVTQPLFRRGYFATRDAGRYGIESAELMAARAREDLARDVVRVYIASVRARKLRDLAVAQVDRTKATVDYLTQLKKAGAALRSAELLAQLDLKRAQRAVVEAERDVGIADASFRRLVGVMPPAQLELPDAPSLPADVAGQELVKGRKDIKALDLEVQASRADEVAAAGQRWWPRLDLVGNVQAGILFDSEFQALLKNENAYGYTWAVSGVLTIPLYQKGATEVQIERAENQTRIAERTRELQAKVATEEAQAAAAQVAGTEQALAIAEKELAGAQEHYKLITLQYKAGAITFLEVTNSQSVLTEAENASVLARIDRVSAAYDYLAAIGALDLAKTK